jgi:malate dehydrogenase (oxaloacetate-decarboxylating)(NADP+)
MDPDKEKFAITTKMRTIQEAIKGADMFLGLSAPNVLTQEDVKKMDKAPLIMALANPTPEIMPEEVRKAKPDAIICTGRSDYPNQVNNVLCFPFIFRGALDVGATAINEEMKLACIEALANLARLEASPEVAAVYREEELQFGPNYMIPKPFDPRLIIELPPAIAKAAMASGVATRPITDWAAYNQKLQSYTYRTSMVMRNIFSRAKENPRRVVFCEGEDERVLSALQTIVDDNVAVPILIGRPKVVNARIRKLGLRIKAGRDFDLIDPEDDPRYRDYWMTYHKMMERRGVTPAMARNVLHTNTTVIGTLMVEKGDADAVICGTIGLYRRHLRHIVNILGLKPGIETAAALHALTLPSGTFFFCDTQINPNPSIAQISEMTLMAAEEVSRFGIQPKIALLSHSNFGTHNDETAFKMQAAYADLKQRAPHLEIEGEMHADAALSASIRQDINPNSSFTGQANLFIMPNIDSANIAFNMLKVLGGGISIGPLLLGVARPAHILTNSVSPRGIVNIAALSTVSALTHEENNPPPGGAGRFSASGI